MSVPTLRAASIALLATIAVAACAPKPAPSASWPPDAIVITADKLAFDTTEFALTADAENTLVLRNLEGQPHNLAITTERGGGGELLFRFDLITATTEVFTVPPIAAGVYFFQCQAHPTMSGTVIVR